MYTIANGQVVEINEDREVREIVERLNIKPMIGTVHNAIDQGYTQEQAVIIGLLDATFERAVEGGLMSGQDAEDVGECVGKMMLIRTGKR